MAGVKSAIRAALGLVGLQVFQARGGVFICPAPRAAKASSAATAMASKRLHLGCGNVHLEGYTNIDIVPTPATDMVADVSRLDTIADDSVDEIRLDAVLEHLFRHQRLAGLKEWFRVLAPRGRLCVRYLPDFDVIVDCYVRHLPGIVGPTFDINEVYRLTHGDPVPWNAPEQVHKDVFTKESVRRELESIGYVNIEIENARYRDEAMAVNINFTAEKPA